MHNGTETVSAWEVWSSENPVAQQFAEDFVLVHQALGMALKRPAGVLRMTIMIGFVPSAPERFPVIVHPTLMLGEWPARAVEQAAIAEAFRALRYTAYSDLSDHGRLAALGRTDPNVFLLLYHERLSREQFGPLTNHALLDLAGRRGTDLRAARDAIAHHVFSSSW